MDLTATELSRLSLTLTLSDSRWEKVGQKRRVNPVSLDSVELTRQIKSASDIVAVVGSYLALKPAGAIFKGLCPFHDDSRPSLDVDPRRQRYRCWACGAHGDVFTFVQHMEKVNFREARALLAAKAGIALREQPSSEDLSRSQLLDAVRWAEKAYQQCLLEDSGSDRARRYLGERRLAGRTVRDFGLGYAPGEGDWLARKAAAENISLELLIQAGLIGERPEGRGHYDRFRDRIMFPIRDVQGRTIAFGGRILPDSPLLPRAPKYYNSAETILFHKSDVLYGLDLARASAAKSGYLALVEGYTDVMMAHQCGFPQVVAAMGTALNTRHIRQICRYVNRIILVYDADVAGQLALEKGVDQFLPYHEIEVHIATLPPGLDPCDLLQSQGGVETFRKALENAVDALDFTLEKLFSACPASGVESERRIVDEVLNRIALAPVARSTSFQMKVELIVTRLAHRLGIRQETIWSRLSELRQKKHEPHRPPAGRNFKPQWVFSRGDEGESFRLEAGINSESHDGSAASGQRPAPQRGPAPAIERQLLELLLAEPALVPKAARTIPCEQVTHTGLRRILKEMYALEASGQLADVDAIRERLSDRPDLAEALLRLQDVGTYIQDRQEWLERIIHAFERHSTEREQRSVKRRLAAADNEQTAVELLQQLQQYARPHRVGTGLVDQPTS